MTTFPPLAAGSPQAAVLLRAWQRPISFTGETSPEHWLLGIEAAARIGAVRYPGERIGAIVTRKSDEVVLQRLLDADGRFFPVMTSPDSDAYRIRPVGLRVDGRIPVRVMAVRTDAVRRMRRMLPILVVDPEALGLVPASDFARFNKDFTPAPRCIRTERVIIVGRANGRVGWQADDILSTSIAPLGPAPLELVLAAE